MNTIHETGAVRPPIAETTDSLLTAAAEIEAYVHDRDDLIRHVVTVLNLERKAHEQFRTTTSRLLSDISRNHRKGSHVATTRAIKAARRVITTSSSNTTQG